MTKVKRSLRVCVVIPAFNEAEVIGSVIRSVTQEFKKTTFNADVVVVNDGSKDTTATVARAAHATVINHILNSGAGGATATGLSYAEQRNYDIAVTMDADGQHRARDVRRGIEAILELKADLLIGSRLIDSEGMSRVKILGNRGLSLITYILFGVSSTDSQSGLRVFSQKALRELRWKTSGYEFCSEMLWRARQRNMTIREYPIEAVYTEYSKAKGQNNWNAINIIKSLLKRRISELFG
ncbi:glycosyltransferase family 2 protein [bacterium]|nr:MAG: glycosyltransferase family 2 protein [bacterium]